MSPESMSRLLEPKGENHGSGEMSLFLLQDSVVDALSTSGDQDYTVPPSAPLEYMAQTSFGPESKLLASTTEPQKSIIYKGLRGVILWPIPALISVSGTIVLLYLNFTEYAIGGEIGTTTKETANILGALQIAVKLHELFIVASLAAIAHQWILGDLMMRGGILFGLLGADLSLADPTFVVSKNYVTALGYGFSGMFRRRNKSLGEKCSRRKVLFLTVYLCTACIIASLAGPASAVLMIPRIDWFFQERMERHHGSAGVVVTDTGYPDILTIPQYSHMFSKAKNRFAWEEWDYVQSGVQYFGEIGAFLRAWDGETSTPNIETTHRTHDYVGDVLFNISTTWGRTLAGAGTGGTSIRTVMRLDVKTNSDYLILNRSYPDTRTWRARKFVVDLTALESWAMCHSDTKIPCGNTTKNGSGWCYKSPSNDTNSPLRHSNNLLLVRQQQNGTGQANGTSFFYPRVWMTEGPHLKDSPKFSTSIEVIFEGDYSPEVVTVCSISTKLKSATATLFDNSLTLNAEQVQYYDYLSHTDGTREEAPTLRFYEKWLDGYGYKDEVYNGNFTFPPRSQSEQVHSGPLRGFADSVRTAIDSRDWDPHDKAGILETVVGGAFTHILAWMTPSTSQYAVPSNVTLPDELMPEPRQTFAPLQVVPINIYTDGYGFRLSTRTGNLGVFVLTAHAFLAVISVVWQLFYRRRVIRSWSTVPEYVALGIGTMARQGVLENTCAGISEAGTLGTVVRVQETTVDHLEVVVLPPPGSLQHPLEPVGVKRYGFYGGGPRKVKFE